MSRPSTSAPSAPRLTALSASTLSSAHERSRSLSLNSPPSVSTNRTILRNLHTLGSGLSVLVKEQREREVEAKRGRVGLEEVRVKEDELEEVRAGMRRVVEVLEADGEGAKMVEEVRREHPYLTSSANEGRSSDGDATFPSTGLSRPSQGTSYSDNPYTAGTSDDDRDRDADSDPDVDDRADLLASQHTILQSQDDSLDKLSASIGRQRDLSLQMNDELELHSELLDDLDRGVEHTGLRLGRASGRLEKVRKSLKDHASTWTIVMLIVILVILIAVFK